MRNKIFGIAGLIISLGIFATPLVTNLVLGTGFLDSIQIESLIIGGFMLAVSMLMLFKKPNKPTNKADEPIKKIFSQKFVFGASILCIVFGIIGMTISTSFFGNVFLFGIILLVSLIIWKLFLIFKGKEKWGVY